jgi:hypothetical protein
LLAEAESNILRALIAVVNETGFWLAAMDGHLQRVGDELGAHVLGHSHPTILRL